MSSAALAGHFCWAASLGRSEPSACCRLHKKQRAGLRRAQAAELGQGKAEPGCVPLRWGSLALSHCRSPLVQARCSGAGGAAASATSQPLCLFSSPPCPCPAVCQLTNQPSLGLSPSWGTFCGYRETRGPHTCPLWLSSSVRDKMPHSRSTTAGTSAPKVVSRGRLWSWRNFCSKLAASWKLPTLLGQLSPSSFRAVPGGWKKGGRGGKGENGGRDVRNAPALDAAEQLAATAAVLLWTVPPGPEMNSAGIRRSRRLRVCVPSVHSSLSGPQVAPGTCSCCCSLCQFVPASAVPRAGLLALENRRLLQTRHVLCQALSSAASPGGMESREGNTENPFRKRISSQGKEGKGWEAVQGCAALPHLGSSQALPWLAWAQPLHAHGGRAGLGSACCPQPSEAQLGSGSEATSGSHPLLPGGGNGLPWVQGSGEEAQPLGAADRWEGPALLAAAPG